MIFLVNSTYHLWVPIYIFNGGEYKSPFMATLIIFEFLISVFCVLYTLKLCELIWKIRVFHVNMSILAVAYLIQYIECFVGKWLMMGHQTGLIGVEGENNVCLSREGYRVGLEIWDVTYIYHQKAEKPLIPNIYSIFALEAWYLRKMRIEK